MSRHITGLLKRLGIIGVIGASCLVTAAVAAPTGMTVPGVARAAAAEVKSDNGLIAVFEAALKKKPKDRNLRNQLVQMYMDDGQYDKALALFEKSMKNGSLIPDSYNRRAMLYYKMKKYEEAKSDLTKALRLEAKDSFADATVNMTEGMMGNILAEEGDYGAALPYFKSIYKRTPNDVLNVFNLAQALELTGQREEARTLYASLVGQARSLNDDIMKKVQYRVDGNWDACRDWI